MAELELVRLPLIFYLLKAYGNCFLFSLGEKENNQGTIYYNEQGDQW